MASLTTNRFTVAEYDRVVWSVVPEEGTAFKDILRPEYWSHVSAKMQPWAKIEVRPEDGSYYAELIVRQAGRSWAKVAPLYYVQLDENAVSPDMDVEEGHQVVWKGPQRKWTVIRLKDKSYLMQGMASKEDAVLWRKNYLQGLAA